MASASAMNRRWDEGAEAVLAFRPVDVQIRPGAGDGRWPGVIVSAVYLGERVEYVVQVVASRVRASGPAANPLSEGTAVQLEIHPEAIHAWPAQS